MSLRLLPHVTALLVGIVAGTIANSPTVAGLGALVFASVWATVDGRDSRP